MKTTKTMEKYNFQNQELSREAALLAILGAAKNVGSPNRRRWQDEEPVPTRVRAGIAA